MPILALTLAALAAPTQVDSLSTVVLQADQVLQTSLGPCDYSLWLGAPSPGVDGGWVTSMSSSSATCIGGVLVGRWSWQPTDSVQILREAQTLQGFEQRFLHASGRPMLNGSLAYTASRAVSPFDRSLWLDDQILALEDDPIPGLPRVWRSFRNCYQTTSGGLIVYGQADGVGGNPNGYTLFDWTNQQVIAAEETAFPGLPSPIDYFLREPVVSPNGEHWAAIVRLRNSALSAVLVDGAVYDFGVGMPAIRLEPLPPSITTAEPGAAWDDFNLVSVNDRGDVALDARTLESHLPKTYLLRNGIPIERGASTLPRTLVSMDSRGAILTNELGTRTLYVEDHPVYSRGLEIDADADGQADPNWVFADQTANRFKEPYANEPTIFTSSIWDSTTSIFTEDDAALRVRGHRLDQATCEGVPNSTGRAADIVISGNRDAASNEITLQSYGLPTQTVGYFLLSRTAGLTVGAGGSQGNLCLGGSIGRLNSQIVATGASDQGKATIDLTAIPQPNGTVSAAGGQTWFFQVWYRDSHQGVATSNFSGAASVLFH